MTLPSDVRVRFDEWFADAKRDEPFDPTAMSLATVGEGGRPQVRTVLLKDADARGFVFYTNRESRKGRALATHSVAALCLHWPKLERQVRVEGAVEHVTDAESDAYFASRPRGSQLGAWASEQSRPLASREALLARVQELDAEYAGRTIPRPPYWGGYRVLPDRVEFWQGQPSRLHDREVWTLEAGAWRTERLAP